MQRAEYSKTYPSQGVAIAVWAALAHVLLFFLFGPMPSLAYPTLSRAHPSRLSVEQVVVRPLRLVFGTNKPSSKE